MYQNITTLYVCQRLQYQKDTGQKPVFTNHKWFSAVKIIKNMTTEEKIQRVPNYIYYESRGTFCCILCRISDYVLTMSLHFLQKLMCNILYRSTSSN